MNRLETYVCVNRLDPIKTMNALMESGLISDNCITVKDVSDADFDKAADWLETQPQEAFQLP